MTLLFLRLQIDLIEKRRLEKFTDADLKALTKLMDDPQLYGIVGAVDDVENGGFGNAALLVIAFSDNVW